MSRRRRKKKSNFLLSVITGIITTGVGGLAVNYLWDIYKNTSQYNGSVNNCILSDGPTIEITETSVSVTPTPSEPTTDPIISNDPTSMVVPVVPDIEATPKQDFDNVTIEEVASTLEDAAVEADNTEKRTIPSIVEMYLNCFVESLNNNDFTYLENTLVPNSPIYKEQKKYVETKKAKEKLISYEIIEQQNVSKDFCIVTIREVYEIYNYKIPLYTGTFENVYTLKYKDDGWLFYSIDSVKSIEN